MSILNGLFGGSYGTTGDATALSPEELQQRFYESSFHMRNATPSMLQIIAMGNYKRPVSVPSGWAEWYAFADEC